MKKKSMSLARAFPALLLFFLCLLPTAYANSTPKPEIYITVANAPAGQVCLGLLMENSWTAGYGEAKYDPAVLDNLRSLEGDGWTLSGYAYPYDDTSPREDGTWLFYREGFSEPFRVAVATADCAQAAETPYTPSGTFVNIVYDWEANTVRETTPPPLRFLARLASTLVPTLLIEGALFWLFGYRQRRSWLVFLAVNGATQLAMHLIFGWTIPGVGVHPSYYVLLFVPSEVVIIAIEAAAYGLLLREKDSGERVGYALLANVTSAALGYFPLHWLYDTLTRM